MTALVSPFVEYSKAMTRRAVGAYLQKLRESSGLSRLAVSRLVETSDSQLLRIENGDQETRASLLAALTSVLNGDPYDVFELILDKQATVDEGTKRAEQLLQRQKSREPMPPLPPVHPDVLRIAQQMTDYELGRWVQLGQRILEERQNSK